MTRRRFLALSAATFAAGCVMRTPHGGIAPPVMDAAAFHAVRRYTGTTFGRIAHVERGSGSAALFLHGFPLNGFQWRGALERLAPYRRCIAPDFLGMGCSEVAEGQSCAPDAQVAMLLALLDALGVDRTDVVANDSGGAVAQLLLARHPERVRSLLLTNCDTEQDSPPPALLPVIVLAKQGRFVDEWLGRWRHDHTLARSTDGIGGMCYADPAHPTDEAIETYFAPLLASRRSRELAHAYAIALERNALASIGPALARSRVPVRIVWGEADTIFAAANADFLDRAFGHSLGVRRLAGSKLFWPEERPEVIAEEARRLWAAADRRA
ncbi:alpha/beta hydrolase [Rhodanobacter thiooxydans]|uniref:Alpha/beta hydrolase n=1 Tax=Rhodanobacter thiooxydans TaxID=416169 RepID=A0A154QFV0_9GAMM|nr:alpha/beta hydrolase [Rhodanobacter thiooxydans]EIM03029.1 putative hydrolase [Rhodanobacter thiooxydans LCS2]KZC22807.1 alpha/beta hydrolase [Rhodanobacter thiooxydans]MCW0200640.1 alpha/beta hydrolase [Rhodanobacter thiooxydans]